MKRFYLIEEILPPKLPVSFPSKIKKQINLIKMIIPMVPQNNYLKDLNVDVNI